MQKYKYCAIALFTLLSIMPFFHQSATAVTKGKRVNLTGQWIVKSPQFYSITPRLTGCHSGSLPGLSKRKFANAKLKMVHQQNGKITIQPFRSWINLQQKKREKFSISNPKVAGKIFSFTEYGGGFKEYFRGTLSKDGNTITGQVSCKHSSGKATAKGPFRLTRILPKSAKTQARIKKRG